MTAFLRDRGAIVALTYSQVCDYREKLRADIDGQLRNLEDSLIIGRDQQQVPIYLTKWRVKSTDSIYLKTKRKSNKSLDEFTDIGGLRILCMFEQSLGPVHNFLIKTLHDKSFKLREFNVFNWHDNSFTEALKTEVDKFYQEYESELEGRQGKYKSIHYVVSRQIGDNNCQIEIQLRTLIQDVWAELEHALVYKQPSVHPHVKRSFDLLARDLETSDLLITYLKDVCEKERLAEQISLKRTGPYRIFWYEKDIVPEVFTANSAIKPLFERYETAASANRGSALSRDFTKTLDELYSEIQTKLQVSDVGNWKVKYWLDMEKAFLCFCKGDYSGAISIYERIIKRGTEQYVPYFRLGEIRFFLGEIEKALVAFDKCEELLSRSGGGSFQADSYRLKVKLANIYWLMGEDYCNIALLEIEQAEQFFNEHYNNTAFFSKADELSLKNNLCWYSLEAYIVSQKRTPSQSNDTYDAALRRFMALEGCLDEPEVSSHAFDTASWFCYHSYLKTREQSWLEKAKRYCTDALERKTSTTLTISSVNFQRSHVQTIMGA